MTNTQKRSKDEYQGFEQGPIRPPSEAESLLIRLTRNCPWNRCTFCPVYKKRRFSLRSVENIVKDIDLLHAYVNGISTRVASGEGFDSTGVNELFNSFETRDRQAFNAALNWYYNGMKSIFLQDANSLIMKPDDIVYILEHIKACFPDVERITSYARSHTIVRISPENMQRIADAGLNRIHIGLESGSDKVLEMVKKGSNKADHIKAGQRVKQSGMQLSEYIMPGLGGKELSRDHALETADALNQINPDYIRIRSLAVPENTPLAEELRQGRFEKCTDFETAGELRLLVENFRGIDSYVKSDHILNLIESLEGRLPDDKDGMLDTIDRFLNMEPEDRVVYQVGRRMGLFSDPNEIHDQSRRSRVEKTLRLYGIDSSNADQTIDELMKRFV
ncbi:MAG: radical SAM protein [Desulfobacteraceae bacterium]